MLGIIGVVLGFCLGACYQHFRECWKRKRLRVQISEEMRANLYSLPHKRATLQTVLSKLAQKQILPGECVPFCDVIFIHHYPDVAPYLSVKEINLLHVVYSHQATVDKTMASFQPDVTAAAPGDPQQCVMNVYSNKLQDLLPLLDQQENLIKSFLKGDPIDVFHMSMDYDAVKNADFAM